MYTLVFDYAVFDIFSLDSSFLDNLVFINPKKNVINTAPNTIIVIVHGRYDLSILNNTFTLNQFWKGRPIPNNIAKKRTFLPKLLPLIFFIWLLTNSLNKPTQQPTQKKIIKKIFIPSFNINAFEIKPKAIKNVDIIITFDFFNILHLVSFIFKLD